MNADDCVPMWACNHEFVHVRRASLLIHLSEAACAIRSSVLRFYAFYFTCKFWTNDLWSNTNADCEDCFSCIYCQKASPLPMKTSQKKWAVARQGSFTFPPSLRPDFSVCFDFLFPFSLKKTEKICRVFCFAFLNIYIFIKPTPSHAAGKFQK